MPWGGSIPACAGEPEGGVQPTPSYRVYPRVCGGTRNRSPNDPLDWGLSPRVRGNRVEGLIDGAPIGSIPACAGEPATPDTHAGQPRVYPRVCGGTPSAAELEARKTGLSPRVRGNHAGVRASDRCDGSIPACAGEPQRRKCRDLLGARVYPRVCGGAFSGGRGCSMRPWEGSIPACAGEPSAKTSMSARSTKRVYPRVCGGAICPGPTWSRLDR